MIESSAAAAVGIAAAALVPKRLLEAAPTDDVLNRTETAMTQAHCFLATELALLAREKARVIG